MAFKFFIVRLGDSAAEAELNAFVSHHKVIRVERHWVDQGSDSFWSMCVDYHAGAPVGRPGEGGRSAGERPRIDYKELLSASDFAVFCRLKELRKEISTREAVPVYTIFNNDHLYRLVKGRVTTKTAMEQVEGIGEGKVTKFAELFLPILVEAYGGVGEANRESVVANPGS